MKTQKINFKKLAATVCAALFIATGSFTQSDAGTQSDVEHVSLASLETLMSLTENSIQYAAPALPASEAYYAEFERLNVLAAATEESVKYEAPEVNDADVAAEFERLDLLAAAAEASMKYEAPEVNDTDLTAEFERLDVLAAATEASIRYNAPEADENINNINQNEIMLVSKTK